MLKAVFFDLDGTLLDTVGDIRAYVNDMLRAFSYPEITEVQARAYVGDGARKLIESSVPKNVANAANVDECYRYFSERFAASENSRTTLFEGEMEVLSALKARGVKLAVITNKPHDATIGSLKKFFPEGTFDYIGGDSGMFACKPDPSHTRFAALTMRVAPRECVFVGDGETDVRTAKNAGMRCISVLWGYRTREQLEKAGAGEFVTSFAELGKILENA